MALTNAQNQARWRERNIEKRRRAQRIANRLVRKIETVKHVEEIAELLASFFDREGHKNAAPEAQGTERVGGYGRSQ